MRMNNDVPAAFCWKCNGPAFNHWLRGYICPYCTNIKVTRQIAKEQAKQDAWVRSQPAVHYVEAPVYVSTPEVQYVESGNDDTPVETKTTFVEGVFITAIGLGAAYVAAAAAWWAVTGVWAHVVYPVVHFISLGFL